MAFSVGFCQNILAKSQASLIPPVFAVSHSSVVSSLSAKNAACHHKKKLKQPRGLTRASAEGLPSELVEDSKFVPLNADDPTYGPPALLLLGFEVEEAEKDLFLRDGLVANLAMPKQLSCEEGKIRQFLKEMDGEFLEIIYCTEDMITRSLWEAVNTRQPNLEEVKKQQIPCSFNRLILFRLPETIMLLCLSEGKIVVLNLFLDEMISKSLPRICFFSGLSGEEMMMFIDAFPETGLEPAVFAALVPNSADKPVAELIDEIMGDHEMLTAQQSGST
ncbi:Uncharacterized protein TCM_043296 isoform 1 [Theobroma cacao]|uniref:Uncharacterized protein isoform 1 n=1 Tax=Theobroma cacao TaxID=3641 RepID=A0A061FP16_THECC|nr:Uncharacterized protein TCM_043296 isoform 1 [Theobroma cacao]